LRAPRDWRLKWNAGFSRRGYRDAPGAAKQRTRDFGAHHIEIPDMGLRTIPE